ncbi:hypothetical protein SDRG_11943 [Saprolegnia diclina VS20]|uniref:Copper transport protein n=1 Tax=Saprolegnia diclina (strain VS20) TaxID=1156394 RepID=T0Q6Z2_SAPDV|nr:hypothetical protein SDRG_11943 [Saprolegnia diclina VS20]EQC30366.1 hypothetical protein SDRG_11943 [Saprolegnia diclina VS20]|eukprot:XP_008616219.1 hypothetical protein SDRG_11943 [Saprolegnia diclina VS20]
MQFARAVLAAVVLLVAMALAQQDLHDTQCPLCAMDVIPSLNQTFKGNQAIYACEMAGHLETLANPAGKVLRGAVPVTALDAPYTHAHMGCPVCGSTDLKYAMTWGTQGNQKLYTCSKEHADLILADQKSYYVGTGPEPVTGFCNHASVMFDGFQSSVGSTCVKLFFQPWVLDSSVKYAFGFIGIVLLGIFLEWLGEYREALEEKFIRVYGVSTDDVLANSCVQLNTPPAFTKSAASSLIDATPTTVKTTKLPLWCSTVLACLYMLALSIGYLIMLVAMLYESGLFVAAILGLGAGFYFFKDTEQDQMSGNIDPCCST